MLKNLVVIIGRGKIYILQFVFFTHIIQHKILHTDIICIMVFYCTHDTNISITSFS